MHVLHWTPLCTWWTVTGVGLYLVCLTGSIRAKTSSGSWWFATPAPVVAIYACLPGVAWITGDPSGIWWALTIMVPMAFLGVLPFHFQQRKLHAESLQKAAWEEAARNARAAHAERVMRSLGA